MHKVLAEKFGPEWWEQDSNLRRLSQRVYSPSPLTARESHRAAAQFSEACDAVALAMKRSRLAVAIFALAAPAADAERVLTPGATLWVDPDSSTAQVGSEDAKRLAAIPSATWLTGGAPRGDARRVTVAASRRGEVPVIVAYNIPGRDCGRVLGGRRGKRAARTARWIDRLAHGISNRRAVVILEPDALAGGLHSARVTSRCAVERLRRLKRTAVYVDAGHSHWQPAKTMVKRLQRERDRHAPTASRSTSPTTARTPS